VIYPCPANCNSTCGCASCVQPVTYPHTVTIPAAEYAVLLAFFDRLEARLALAERVVAVLRGRDAPSGEHSWREWHRMLAEWDARGET